MEACSGLIREPIMIVDPTALFCCTLSYKVIIGKGAFLSKCFERQLLIPSVHRSQHSVILFVMDRTTLQSAGHTLATISNLQRSDRVRLHPNAAAKRNCTWGFGDILACFSMCMYMYRPKNLKLELKSLGNSSFVSPNIVLPVTLEDIMRFFKSFFYTLDYYYLQ